MNPDTDDLTELRIAVALRAGWRCLCGHDWIAPGEPADAKYAQELPDYTGSLDAMRPLLLAMTEIQRARFGEQLCKIVPSKYGFHLYVKYPWSGREVETLVTASPEQICRAYLTATEPASDKEGK